MHKPQYKSHKLMGILWADTGAIGCVRLLSYAPHSYPLQSSHEPAGTGHRAVSSSEDGHTPKLEE